MKRKAALLLSAVMAVSSLPTTAYAANFKDIGDVAWAAGTIASVADKGLLSGYEDNTFRGKNNVTYCEAMQMVYTVLNKTGALEPADAVTLYSYMTLLDTYDIPKWSQMAVAYGVAYNIIDMGMVVKSFAGGKTAATREDVAIMFGNAMGIVFGKEKSTSDAAKFVDYSSISADAAEQVSLLVKMGIVGGDTTNRFNPKKNISRAEMAVMLHNTYGVLSEGVNYSGEITKLTRNQGTDGTEYFYIGIKTDAGRTEGFTLAEGDVPVYDGDTTKTLSLSSLSEGNGVVFMISGDKLVGIRRTSGTTKQVKYDITGYITALKENSLTLENENTGESTKYPLESGVVCTINDKTVSRKELEASLKEHAGDYAYARLITSVKQEKVDKVSTSVTHIKEIHVTYHQNYTAVGTVTSFMDKQITLKMAEGSVTKTYFLMDDCEYMIDGVDASHEDAKKMVGRGTTYAKVYVGAEDKAVQVELSETTFSEVKNITAEKTYRLDSLSDKKIIVESGSEKETFSFTSAHPLDNITFHIYDRDTKTWEEVSKIAAAEKSVEKWEDDDFTIYVRLSFNSNGKINAIYFSNAKNAWKESEDMQTERKGIVASLKDDVLKFKESSLEYKLKTSYKKEEGAEAPLQIHSLWTESGNMVTSKAGFAKVANNTGLEVYAEIAADGDNEVIKADVRVQSAKGKLVEFNQEERYIEIEAGGEKVKLNSNKNPKLPDEKKYVFELEDLVGENSKYIGDTVVLGFGDNGFVNQITLGNGTKSESGSKIKGIAELTNAGLEIDGTEYKWKGKKSDIDTTNYSGSAQSLDMIQRMIGDSDMEIYVEVQLEENASGEKVIGKVNAYVREAVGELREYDHTIQIRTEAGNTFAFYANNKLNPCDVDGYGQEDIKVRKKGIGATVVLTFDETGSVSGMESK